MAVTQSATKAQKPDTTSRTMKFNGQAVNAPAPAARPAFTGGPIPGSQPGAFTGSEPKNAGAGYQYQGPSMMANQLNQSATPQPAGPGNPVPTLNDMVQAMSKHVTGIQSGFQKWLENIWANMRQSNQTPVPTPINPNPISGPVLGG